MELQYKKMMLEKYDENFLLWRNVLYWMAFIFILSSIPKKYLPNVGIANIHAIAHFIEYCTLGMLVLNAFRKSSPAHRMIVLASLTLAVIAGYAVIDELHQTFVSGRVGALSDVIRDALFACVGMALYNFKSGISILREAIQS